LENKDFILKSLKQLFENSKLKNTNFETKIYEIYFSRIRSYKVKQSTFDQNIKDGVVTFYNSTHDLVKSFSKKNFNNFFNRIENYLKK